MTLPRWLEESPDVICGARVGANRCRLIPHDTGRHDVAPDYLLDRYVVPTGLLEPRDEPRHALERMAEMLTRPLLGYICPATTRQCSCRPGERCNPAVFPARGPG